MAKNSGNRNSRRLLVPGSEGALDQMKFEIASEFGVNLGPETSSRDNGQVGGEITRRLVAQGLGHGHAFGREGRERNL